MAVKIFGRVKEVPIIQRIQMPNPQESRPAPLTFFNEYQIALKKISELENRLLARTEEEIGFFKKLWFKLRNWFYGV